MHVGNQFKPFLKDMEEDAADFFMAASLYHAGKVSFHAAAELAGLSFEGFHQRLRQHFQFGFIVADEVVSDDISFLSNARK